MKQIQSSEFFDLSAKLLPREFPATTDEDSVVLTLENSIIKVKKANQPTQKIADIEQWTTAFTIYMGVFNFQVSHPIARAASIYVPHSICLPNLSGSWLVYL